ncbi:hypothetical protein AB0M36_02770 [Actinoplanes sp. NPDC051346]|uniref:hypothetical protein n=1 Tax=Actinoplanes sp. NPDC051346 TaxID=3155048 RepID=UPI00342B20B1
MTDESPGGWCTNWSAYNVESIWEMVRLEGEKKGDNRWQQVHTWAAIETALHAHGAWLTAFQAEIERVWPSTGAASAAFGREIDTLKASMDQTVVAAGRTKHALNDILTTIEETKAKIREVHEEYDKKSHDAMIRQVDGAEDKLNEKARRIMAESENVVRQRTVSIVPPPAFRRLIDGAGEDDSRPGGGSSGSGVGAGGVFPPVRHDPPAPLPGVDPVMPDGKDWEPSVPDGSNGAGTGNGGPALSGVISPQAPPPTQSAVIPTTASTLPAGGGGGPTGLLPGGIGPVIGGGPAVVGGGGARGGVKPFATLPTAGRPVNGVIGGGVGGRPGGAGGSVAGVGGSPARASGSPAGGRAAGGRTAGMPANGIIGGNQAGPRSAAGTRGLSGGPGTGSRAATGATGRGPGAGMTPGHGAGVTPAPTGRRGDSESGQETLSWDPDNPWEVAEGGPAVIEPDLRTHHHDAGPGVIGRW